MLLADICRVQKSNYRLFVSRICGLSKHFSRTLLLMTIICYYWRNVFVALPTVPDWTDMAIETIQTDWLRIIPLMLSITLKWTLSKLQTHKLKNVFGPVCLFCPNSFYKLYLSVKTAVANQIQAHISNILYTIQISVIIVKIMKYYYPFLFFWLNTHTHTHELPYGFALDPLRWSLNQMWSTCWTSLKSLSCTKTTATSSLHLASQMTQIQKQLIYIVSAKALKTEQTWLPHYILWTFSVGNLSIILLIIQ